MRDWEQAKTEFGPMVWATISRIVSQHADALDCFQDVMIEAFQKDQNSQIHNLPGLLKWLAVRRSLDLLRANKREGDGRIFDEPQERAAEQNEAGDALELEELMDRVRIELSKMPANQAQAFWLCCIEQQSYIEAAAHLQTDKSHVGVLVFRAREKLRLSLDDIKPSSIRN
ncbi:RNA polymerase sigma factor [Novipirellula artificiosorum]|uniref:RNA polymerase sigma factor n=1 Tax=Novipirellula artificiosorum TaxID=2528016 RepID=A0A5C6DTA4_9BACT|nr:sigma-70 family RNA polymerase sigma factor [Novipirellula artificiosorum]TWU39535.1 RNA polymerase sigma factor [Novipirellula artificiosorum]